MSFANANICLSRNFTPCKIPAFSHSFLVKKFSINGQFPQILWNFAQNSVDIVCLQIISRKVYGKACISQGAIYIAAIFFRNIL